LLDEMDGLNLNGNGENAIAENDDEDLVSWEIIFGLDLLLTVHSCVVVVCRISSFFFYGHLVNSLHIQETQPFLRIHQTTFVCIFNTRYN
jgi:hypothetical protein